MNNQLQVFNFEAHPVRMAGTPGHPLVMVKDVCSALALGNVTMATARLRPKEKVFITVESPGGPQEALFITEPGLYRLIMTSRKAEAERFQDWLFEEVLPSIRKTGRYEVPAAVPVALEEPRPRDHVLASVVVEYVRHIGGLYDGYSRTLWERIGATLGEELTGAVCYPVTAVGFGKRLSAVRPLLEASGMTVRRHHNKRGSVILVIVPEASVLALPEPKREPSPELVEFRENARLRETVVNLALENTRLRQRLEGGS